MTSTVPSSLDTTPRRPGFARAGAVAAAVVAALVVWTVAVPLFGVDCWSGPAPAAGTARPSEPARWWP